MVVFHDNGVAKPEAVRAAVAEMQRALVEQSPGSLARADDSRGGTLAFGALLETANRGRDAAHSLNQIQPHAFEREQLHFVALRSQQQVTGSDRVAVALLQGGNDTLSPQQESQFGQARNHAASARQDYRLGAPSAGPESRDREIPRCKIGTQQSLREGANGIAVFRMVEREARAPEEGCLGSLFARKVHAKVCLGSLCYFRRKPRARSCVFAREIISGREASTVCRCTPSVSEESSAACDARTCSRKSCRSARDSSISEP